MNVDLSSTSQGSVARAARQHSAANKGLLVALIVLFKPRIIALVLITGLVSMIASGGSLTLARVGLFLAGCATAAAGAAALNHYLDRDIDRVMERTRSRPLPTGAISPRAAQIIGFGLLALALPLLAPLGEAVIAWGSMAAAFYVVVYTMLLKRRSHWNVVIGGWTGSCVVLAGWQATGAELTPSAWALAGVVLCWTPAHFWSLAINRIEDYRLVEVPMLPVVKGIPYAARATLISALLAIALSFVPWAVGEVGNVYLLIASAVSGLFVRRCIGLVRCPSRAQAFATYKLSGIYLATIFMAVAIDRLISVGLA
ncbi:MAG: protoheme IX farnesyltransferase [Chloroflexi bacterium]|nr:protoheme IX farnesyltransferase [Chloroflexota bacterium]